MKLKFSASSMLLLPQGWPEWHHFVLGLLEEVRTWDVVIILSICFWCYLGNKESR